MQFERHQEISLGNCLLKFLTKNWFKCFVNTIKKSLKLHCDREKFKYLKYSTKLYVILITSVLTFTVHCLYILSTRCSSTILNFLIQFQKCDLFSTSTHELLQWTSLNQRIYKLVIMTTIKCQWLKAYNYFDAQSNRLEPNWTKQKHTNSACFTIRSLIIV